jgi:hypothetical protein
MVQDLLSNVSADERAAEDLPLDCMSRCTLLDAVLQCAAAALDTARIRILPSNIEMVKKNSVILP